jgi:hypothetical protein
VLVVPSLEASELKLPPAGLVQKLSKAKGYNESGYKTLSAFHEG